MPKPATYFEWVKLLDKYEKGDDSVLITLNEYSFKVDSGTASRFYIKIEQVYKKRKQDWLDKFNRLSDMNHVKSETDFEIILSNGKRNLSSLKNFIALNGLPEDLSKTLYNDLEGFVTEIKKNLTANASKMSNGREGILILINNFDLKSIPCNFKTSSKNEIISQEIFTPTRRKIIF